MSRARSLPALGIAVLLSAAVIACGAGTATDVRQAGGTRSTAASAAPTHWEYEGARGPGAWGGLDPAFAACAAGREQSPVDLSAAAATPGARPVVVDYRPTVPTEVVNTGHTIQVNLPAGNALTVDGTRYELRQFHFHLPSEHTVDGANRDMELHLVHQNESGGLAVLGVLLTAAEAGSPFGSLWTVLPGAAGAKAAFDRPVDLIAFLPAARAQLRYPGSLTTPPCTEGVAWTVLTDPMPIGPDQLTRYRQLFTGSNRPTQPLGVRKVGSAG